MISFLLLLFNNFQEQCSSRRAILADASQDAIMSLSVGTDEEEEHSERGGAFSAAEKKGVDV